jgi:hypothetical protein
MAKMVVVDALCVIVCILQAPTSKEDSTWSQVYPAACKSHKPWRLAMKRSTLTLLIALSLVVTASTGSGDAPKKTAQDLLNDGLAAASTVVGWQDIRGRP